MKTLQAFLFLTTTLAGTSVAQMFTPACPMLKPITDLPPLGHPNASQQCVCQSMNRGCHWAWVDPQQPTSNPPPYVNQFDQALRDRIAAQRREKELREQQQFIEQQQREAEQQQRETEARQDARVKVQSDQANDLEILKAVHDGVLVPVTHADPTASESCNSQPTANRKDQCKAELAAQATAEGPTIKNSSGQEFRVVAPASDHPTPTAAASDSSQYFTQGLLNGNMWLTMSAPDKAFYVAAYLQGYMVSCLSTTDDAAQQKACYAKLGDIAHTNPVDPHEIVNGVDGIFAAPDNRGLIIPVAIRAASMKASGENQYNVERYLATERMSVAALLKN